MKKLSRPMILLLGLACSLLVACTNTIDGGIANRPQIAAGGMQDGVIGQAYSTTLQANGGVTPLTWSISSGSLPAGLTLNATTGVISGTPAGPAGTATFSSQPPRRTENDGSG